MEQIDAASLLEIATEAVSQSGMRFDQASGMYYDQEKDLYYDMNSAVYYDYRGVTQNSFSATSSFIKCSHIIYVIPTCRKLEFITKWMR